ncbi:HD-GYP domain-containing protein [Ghiorsea bivora]|uniref:HD-GYP domain-containing protein n=1 Tax=Ghiorsea bivora TaxID=1485545 RepID=UPI00056F5CE9|nr:HD domain-containing phosphohydrolase [Ghiorsea bivora]
MTKYFDLLRAHQQHKKHATTDDSIKVTEAANTTSNQHNPYAQQGENHDSTLEPVVTTELLDEANLPEDEQTSQAQELSIDALPNEEENTQEAVKQKPITENTSTHIHNFSVATWLQEVSQSLQTIFQAAEKQEATDLSTLDTSLQNLMEQLEDNTKVLDALELEISRNIKQICNTDCSVNDLVEKSIMMMLYTIKISLRLKLQHNAIVQHASAAMLHHIGMAMVPSEVRQKVGKLTKDELALIRQAPENAVKYLKSCHVSHENILLAAEQAAERYDGSGPQGLSGHDIAWIARVVGLLSMFEALIHIRPYRPRLLPRDAIRELVNRHKKAFDPILLKALIEAVSLYPVGTFVQLNTGEIGQVIMVHSKFPLRPVVYINMDSNGNPITAREIDLKQQPNLMIQKCMYEESLGSDNT